MISVGNRRRGDAGEYIGRPSPLGNPFVIGRDGTRKEVIGKYRAWFLDQLVNHDEAFHAEFTRLCKLAAEEDITLVCWCNPQACHGDVIEEMIRDYTPIFGEE